jgi:hypothetical protein
MLDVAKHRAFKERFAAIRTLEPEALLPPEQALQSTLMDAGTGAFFEYLGLTFLVREKNQYEETSENFKTKKGYFIYELTCLCLDSGETRYFEWEYDDELEVAVTCDRLTFKNLKDDEGQPIDGDDLDQIAEDSDAVIYDSQKFWYEDDWAAVFTRNGKDEQVYVYEFENEKGTRFLTIEEWQGSGRDEYRIYTSEPVQSDSISLISKGDGTP